MLHTPSSGWTVRVSSGVPPSRLSGRYSQSFSSSWFCDCCCSRDNRVRLVSFVGVHALMSLTSEQLIPMFGLVKLEEQIGPHTSLDKILFLVEYVWTDSHKLTTLVSFGVLFVLIFLRLFKQSFKRTWWIYRLPEVLLVVVAFTCKLHSSNDASTYFFIGISNEMHWDQGGVAILGPVSISMGSHFFKFPLGSHTYSLLRGTTSTAM